MVGQPCRRPVRSGPASASVRGADSSGSEWPDAGASTTTRSKTRRPSRRVSSQARSFCRIEELGQPGRGGREHLEARALEEPAARARESAARRGRSRRAPPPARRVANDRPGDTICGSRPPCVAPSRAPSRRASDLDGEHPPARRGDRACQGGGHGALPDAALAGHHDQPLGVQGEGRGHRRGHSGGVRDESISWLDAGRSRPSIRQAARRPSAGAAAGAGGATAGGCRASIRERSQSASMPRWCAIHRKEKGASSSDRNHAEGVVALGPGGGADEHREGLARARPRPGGGSGCRRCRGRPAGTRGEGRGRTAPAPRYRRSGLTGKGRPGCAARRVS